MTERQKVSLFAAILMMSLGAYMVFVSGETIGSVFIACGAVFAATSAASGSSTETKKKDETDAGR